MKNTPSTILRTPVTILRASHSSCKKLLRLLCLVIPGVTWLSASRPALAQSHAHINAGAISQTPGSQLTFVNGGSYVTNSGYIQPLTLRSSGNYSGYYEGALTFTAEPVTPEAGGPGLNPALLGSRLMLQVVSVDGPSGSQFGFWETPSEENELEARTIAFSVPVGTRNGMNRLYLSSMIYNLGFPTDDPYGHIHGRHFTTTRPGLHVVGFRIIDVARNGPNGGPLHQPSDLYWLYFQAGHVIHTVYKSPSEVTVRFGAINGSRYFLESRDRLDETAPWTTEAGPVAAINRVQALSASDSGGNTQRYFRLRVE